MSVAAPRIAFLVTSLSGSGHLVRILALAEASAAAGARVLVLSGGRPLRHLAAPRVPLVQLPPLLVAGRDFSRPTDAAGQPADDALMTARSDAIETALTTFAADVLVTETWPLGRRRLDSEFAAAVGAARAARPCLKLFASVRDVPEPPSRPDRIAGAAARLKDVFDGVLCHGDAGFLPLSASWPLPGGGPPVWHTGYVAAPQPVPAPRSDEVLVAVGGGDLGATLLEKAATAATLGHRPWRLRVGGPAATAQAAALAARHPSPALRIEAAAPDYRSLLAGAAASVSLAGYNTVTDLAPLDVPALLVPDETGGEREQAIRAAALVSQPGIAVRALDTLTPEGLAALVEELASGPRRPPLPLSLDGAAATAALLMKSAHAEEDA
ncbi:MAG: glycosyltransferase [Pseudomonadota bacterium]